MVKFEKDIVVFDVETTGLKIATNHIIQLSALKLSKDTLEEIDRFDRYIIPVGEWEIEESAFEVHGYTKEFIINNGIPLKLAAEEFMQFIENCDLLTYNGNKFDIPFVAKEFELVDIVLDIQNRTVFDSFLMEKIVNSHTLEATYYRYTGLDTGCAHNSLCDVLMTAEVFRQQISRKNIDQMIDEGLKTKMAFPENLLDVNENGDAYFTVGKHEGQLVNDVCRSDAKYIQWLFNSVLTRGTKTYIMDHYNK